MSFRPSEPGLSILTVLALGVAGTALADGPDDLADRYRTALDACYDAAGADDLAACKGVLADACMAAEENGLTTAGMMSCTLAEAGVWAEYLAKEYGRNLARAESFDAIERETFPDFANFTSALAAAQAAWATYSDAECSVEYARWGAGSMRMLAGASCRLDMNAGRTIALRALREDF